ncbi:MAG: hypothetical protein GXP49_03495, partial [Deltaproteobacteria bacterium]|nr:hypothetical protein [Deltaproteobacteria bacterium]
AGDREWKVAYHPYPPGWSLPDFGPKDLPLVTFGNIGVLVGYLMARFPDHPHAWEVLLTEQGINSGTGSSEEKQNKAICDAYRNVLGTPGVTTFIYYRLQDFGAIENGSAMGLIREDGSLKPSWYTWSMMNRIDLSPPQLACGFEDLPYVVIRRGNGGFDGHWASTRKLPEGFVLEGKGWKILREEAPGTRMLFECAKSKHNFLSLDVNCGGQQPMGPVGWIWTSQEAGTVPFFACSTRFGDNFVSTDSNCEGKTKDGLLGYVLPVE